MIKPQHIKKSTATRCYCSSRPHQCHCHHQFIMCLVQKCHQ